MTRILHLIEDIAPHSGGPTSVVVDLTSGQAARGHEVTLVSASPVESEEIRSMLAVRWGPSRARPALLAASGDVKFSKFVAEILERQQPEIVHLHGVFGLCLGTTARSCMRKRIPFVCSTHGMLHPDALASKWLKKHLYLALLGVAIRRAEIVLTLNNEENEHSRATFNPNSLVLENGVYPEQFERLSSDEFFRKNPELLDRPYMLFVGRLHPIKGIDGLVRSLAIAKSMGLSHRLVCIGPDEGASASIRALIHSLGLDNDVCLLPACYGSAKLSAIAGCDMFVHRPRFEGFGIAVLEALAAGKSVVTTKLCRLDRAFADGVITAAPNTDEGFAAAMVETARHSRSRSESSNDPVAWVRSNLAWDVIVTRLDDIYRHAMAMV